MEHHFELTSPDPVEAQVLTVGSGSEFKRSLEAFLTTAFDSVHTRRAYRRHIQDAFDVMAVSSVPLLTPEHLAHYRKTLLGDGRGAATHAQALSSLRSYLAWCADLGGLKLPLRVAERLLRVPKADVVRPYVICTRSEVERILESAVNLRDKALILVMLGGGLRVSEVEALDCTDLIEVDGEPVLWVRQGKGNKDRFVPVNEEVALAIHRYLANEGRRIGDRQPLFLAEDRGVDARDTPRLSHYGIRKILKAIVRDAFVAKRITPHALRHTFGMEFQRKGGDLNKTAKVMGHATLRPTLRYTDHLNLRELRTALPAWAAGATEDEP